MGVVIYSVTAGLRRNVGCHEMRTATYSFVVILLALTTQAQQTNSPAKDWQITTNAIGRDSTTAIVFTCQSQLCGTQYVEINKEIIRRWSEIAPIANQSGLTQAVVIAKGNPTNNNPPAWRIGQCLGFQRRGESQWILKSLYNTNDLGRPLEDLKE